MACVFTSNLQVNLPKKLREIDLAYPCREETLRKSYQNIPYPTQFAHKRVCKFRSLGSALTVESNLHNLTHALQLT